MPVNEKLWAACGYKPHEKQYEFHASDARFKVPVCGRRFGKSKMAAMEVLPELFVPDNRGWIIAPQYSVGEKEFRYVWDALVIRMGSSVNDKIKRKAYNVRTGEMYIEMKWGARIDVMSADHPDALVGEGLDYAIFSEAAKQPAQIWEKYVRPSLADRHGTAIFPSTPEGFNWYYNRYLDGQNEEMFEWESWQYPSWFNPYVYPGGFDDPEIQSQLRRPDDPWFWQELGADFRSVVGLVYQEFDADAHVSRWDYDPRLPNYLCYDPGYTNPFAVYDVQVTPMDEVKVWREYYETQKPRHVVARDLVTRKQPEGYHVNLAYGDSADPDTVETLGAFYPVVAYDEAKDWLTGKDEVKKFLTRPGGLTIDPSCVEMVFEFNNYKIKAPRTIRTLEENLKEEPAKKYDHAMDALRYFIMHHFVIGADAHLDQSMVSRDATFSDGGGMFQLDSPTIFSDASSIFRSGR